MSQDTKIVMGAQNIRALFSELAATAKTAGVPMLYGITDLDRLKVHFPEFDVYSANASREEAQLPSRLIYCSSEGPTLNTSDRLSDRESRYAQECIFESDISIIGDTVVLVAISNDPEVEPQAVIISSRHHANDFRRFFNRHWSRLKTT